MPELPEVETIKRQLAKKIIGKKLGKETIASLERKGKLLFLNFKSKKSLVFHLKMTGQLIFNSSKNKHTRHIFNFTDGSRLLFNDLRKFGWFKVVTPDEKATLVSHLGRDALLIKEDEFGELFKTKRKIKPFLVDQGLIAGIGNIYADEILFQAKIRPERRVASLSQKEISSLYQAMRKILLKAVRKRGSSSKDYLDALGKPGDYLKEHKVYQRTGKDCLICKTPIKRVKINQRSAHYCPVCQK